MSNTVWYARLSAVPGMEYAAPGHIRRPEMAERFLKPELVEYTFGGERRMSLSWPTENGSTSASPSHRWGSDIDSRNASAAVILQRLYEKLELPGIGSDYHFALLQAYEGLQSLARHFPELLEDVERLCLLDMELIERIQGIWEDFDPMPPPFVPAYGWLIKIYERNGLIDEALSIARRAAANGQRTNEVERLEERLAALRAEDA